MDTNHCCHHIKDEADIIDLNLEHLIRRGVRSFVIYDDGSKDNALEKIGAVGSRHEELNIVLGKYSNAARR